MILVPQPKIGVTKFWDFYMNHNFHLQSHHLDSARPTICSKDIPKRKRRFEIWRTAFILIALVPVLIPNIATASAEEVYLECRIAVKMLSRSGRADSSAEAKQAEACITYMKGYRHGLEAQLLRMVEDGVLKRRGKGHYICQPESATVGDYISAFVQFLDKNPTLKSQHEAIVIFLALENRYPCP